MEIIIALTLGLFGIIFLQKSLKKISGAYTFLGGLFLCIALDILFIYPDYHDWVMALVIEIILLLLVAVGILLIISGIIRTKRGAQYTHLYVFLGLSFIVNYFVWIVITTYL